MSSKKKQVKWHLLDGKERKDELLAELNRFNSDLQVRQREEKYQILKDKDSAFVFFRATAHLYYHDLARYGLPLAEDFSNVETNTWIQGDLHIGNIGAFADVDGQVVYDINDFDEALVANYLYDLLRAAVSVCLQGVANDLSEDQVTDGLDIFLDAYLRKIGDYQEKQPTGFDEITRKNAKGPLKKFLKKVAKKAGTRSMLEEWTVLDGGIRRFDTDLPKLEKISDEDKRMLQSVIALYKDHLLEPNLRGKEDWFTVLDCAKRTGAGVGSFGTPRYYVLIRGASDSPDDEVILDVKQQGMPSIFPFLSRAEQKKLMTKYDDECAGLRVSYAQKVMLEGSSDYLGYLTALGRSFSVRERSPFKKNMKYNKLKGMEDFRKMLPYWGQVVATAHARGDACADVPTHNFEAALVKLVEGREKQFRHQISEFAFAYAEQARLDYKTYLNLYEDNLLY